MKRLLFYGGVGGIGFVVDAALLTLLVSLGVNPYLARLLSFPPAVVTTWALNRQLVFKSNANSLKSRSGEYGRYFLVQTLGATINITIYVGVLFLFHLWPIVALAAGSVGALVFNYSGSRFWVFR